MAPSRDRLLHFGFKATVSDRGRELDGREGRVCQHRLPGQKRQDLGGWKTRQKAQVRSGLDWAEYPPRGYKGQGSVGRCPAFLSRVCEHARTRTRPAVPPIHKYRQTQALPCLSVRWAYESGRQERTLAAAAAATVLQLLPG